MLEIRFSTKKRATRDMYATHSQSLSVIQVVRKNIDRNQIIIEAVNLPKTQVLEKQGKHSNEDLN